MKILQTWCCWGTDYCKCEILGLSRNQNIKLTYISLVVVLLVITNVVGKYKNQSESLTGLFQCDTNTSNPSKQASYNYAQIINLWFLALTFMHFALVILVVLRNQLSKIFNQGAWFLKMFFVTGFGFIFMYLLPHNFIYFMQVGFAYLVPIWYLFQNLKIIDMIYNIDMALKQAADRNNKMHILKALLAILSIIGAVVINVLSYTNFKDSQIGLYIPILNSIHLGVYLIVVLLRVVKGNTLLVYGLVMFYQNLIGYYLRYPAQQYGNTLQPVIQTVLMVITLFGILSPGSDKVRTKKSSLTEVLALTTSKQEEDNRYVSSNKWVVFHIAFFIISGTITWVIYQQAESFQYEENLTNAWIQKFKLFRIIGWYIIIIIYFWTLLAARLFPQQDFDQLQNYFKQFELN